MRGEKKVRKVSEREVVERREEWAQGERACTHSEREEKVVLGDTRPPSVSEDAEGGTEVQKANDEDEGKANDQRSQSVVQGKLQSERQAINSGPLGRSEAGSPVTEPNAACKTKMRNASGDSMQTRTQNMRRTKERGNGHAKGRIQLVCRGERVVRFVDNNGQFCGLLDEDVQ
ncbi:uncharacterized protein SPSK_05597 [Sporothrix schenckii 1099-18]|uniref:Uncharacterized protein n=1 Tax=Sporothrix schenckii 1099-18 TaxID=1397361 RepID=A0A0F2LXP2_SPOSC|nr:uncharacterized protein SPSK_05597 [Sporothrix schenckii 1099-18]KJR80666.1 hypothetical protein SPSK_05597 [Sporothrix schenckii 1099-18]